MKQFTIAFTAAFIVGFFSTLALMGCDRSPSKPDKPVAPVVVDEKCKCGGDCACGCGKDCKCDEVKDIAKGEIEVTITNKTEIILDGKKVKLEDVDLEKVHVLEIKLDSKTHKATKMVFESDEAK